MTIMIEPFGKESTDKASSSGGRKALIERLWQSTFESDRRDAHAVRTTLLLLLSALSIFVNFIRVYAVDYSGL